MRYLTQPPIELPCCQLLAGLNAMRHLGLSTPEPPCPVFEYLVDAADARNHGAQTVGEAWEDLGLVWVAGRPTYDWILSYTYWGHPVAVTYEYPDKTAHTALIIAADNGYLVMVNWVEHRPISPVKYADIEKGLRGTAFAFTHIGDRR